MTIAYILDACSNNELVIVTKLYQLHIKQTGNHYTDCKLEFEFFQNNVKDQFEVVIENPLSNQLITT